MRSNNFYDFGISVVCPTFNSSNYISRTIKSLLKQIKAPNEIIFSDDGSTDSTINIIESYRDSFEKLKISLIVLLNDHQGPGAARNSGINIASQEWISFLDSDDIWKENKISEVYKCINNESKSNCFLHWEHYFVGNKKNKTLKHGYNFYNPNKDLLKQLYERNFLSTSAVVCKKKLIKKVGGFDNSLPNAQDYDLWLKMSKRINLTIIPEVLGEYHATNGNITSRPYSKRIKSEIRIAFRYRDRVSLFEFIKKIFQLIFSINWFHPIIKLFKKV